MKLLETLLLGASFLATGLMTPAASGSVTLKTLVTFTYDSSNGFNPQGGLVLGNDGNFYGTTSIGGSVGGGGTVFRMSPDGTLSNLSSFSFDNSLTNGL